MTFRTLIKLVWLTTCFSVLVATYGARVLLSLEGGHRLIDVSCDQKTDQQATDDDDVKPNPPEDPTTCWSSLTDIRPQILTDATPEAITDAPSEAVSDMPPEPVTDTPTVAVSDTPTVVLQ
jgi:hypothetical protein